MSITVTMNDILATVTLASLVVSWLQNQPPTIFNILSVFCFGFFPDNKPLFEVEFSVENIEKPLPQPEPQDEELEAEETQGTQETSQGTQETSQGTQETSQGTQETSQEAEDEELEEGEIREEMVEEHKSLSSYNEALLHEVVREIIREQTTMTDDAPTQTTSDDIPVSAPEIPVSVPSSEVPVQ